MMMASLGTAQAQAQAQTAPDAPRIEASVASGIRYDDNLFRLPSGRDVPVGRCKSDRIGRISADITARPLLSGWRTSLRGGVYRDFYDCNDGLDNTGYNVDASIANDGGGIFSASLSGQARRQQTSFGDVQQFVQNIQNYAQVSSQLGVAVTPEIRIITTPHFSRSTNSSDLFRPLDYDRYGAGLGVGWFTPLGNSITIELSQEQVDGRRSRLVTFGSGAPTDARTDLRDRAVDVKLNYAISALTEIKVDVSYVDRQDQSGLDADFNGVIGEVSASYRPTESWTFRLAAGRRLESQNALFVDAVLNDFVQVDSQTTLGGLVEVQATAEGYRRRFRFDSISGITTDQVDRTLLLQLRARVPVWENLSAQATVTHTRRSGSVLFGDFAATAAGVDLVYKFGTAN